ncbi:MAG: DNA-directed RNA polymerase subunit alpha C-terminal domain-containing protein [Bacteroidota bacterium]
MKREVKKLIRLLFRDKEFFESIGFSTEESVVFFSLLNGKSTSSISHEMGLSIHKVRHIKRERFHLIPLFIHRKLEQISREGRSQVRDNLQQMEQLVSDCLQQFRRMQEYSIHELSLSRRTVNALVAHRIQNTRNLLQYSRSDLLAIRNIGEEALREIEMELSRLGLDLLD